MSRSYTFYKNLSYSSVALLVGSYLITFFTAAPFVLCKGCSLSFAYELLSFTYGGKIKLKKLPDKNKPLKLSLYGFELDTVTVMALFNGTICVYICAFTTFFSELLITESTNQCDINMDCFALNASSKSLVQQDSLQEECLEYLLNTSYTIQCYKLSFNYVSAIGSTGGVLIVGFFVLKTQAALAARLLRVKNRRKGCGIFILSEYLFLIIITLTLGLTLGLVDEFSESVFSSITSITEFAAYLWTIYYSIWTSVRFFYKTFRSESCEEEYLVHRAETVEHAEIVIIAAEVGGKNEKIASNNEKKLPETFRPCEHEVFVRLVKNAKLVIEANSVAQSSNVIESFSLPTVDAGVLHRDNPLPHNNSSTAINMLENFVPTGRIVKLIGDAEKVLKADHVIKADIVIRLTKTPVDHVSPPSSIIDPN